MQIALSEDAAIALCVVHRSVGRVKVYKGVQTLLYIHARTKRGGTAEYHTHLTSVNLVEDFQLLLYGHAGLHHNDLIFGDALLNELLFYVLIQIETATLVLVVVGKDGYRSLVAISFFQRAQCLTHGLIGLAVRIVLCIHFHKSSIYCGSLGNAIHGEGDAAVLFFLLAAHLIKTVKLSSHILHHAAQCACLWQIDILRLTTLHFGYFLDQFRLVFGQNRVSHARPYTNQFGQVYIPCKTVYFLEFAACAEFHHLLQIAEVAHKIVKVVDAIFLHRVLGHKVAHESPNLCGRVADRCTGGKDNVSAIVPLQYGLRLQVYALRLLAV